MIDTVVTAFPEIKVERKETSYENSLAKKAIFPITPFYA